MYLKEAFANGLADDATGTVLILGFESGLKRLPSLTICATEYNPPIYSAKIDNFDPWMDRALAICKNYGGKWDPKQQATRTLATARSEGAVAAAGNNNNASARAEERWKRSFLRAPYLRDAIAARGLIMETFEVRLRPSVGDVHV